MSARAAGLPALVLVSLALAAITAPARAGDWDIAVSAIVGGSFPLTIDGIRERDPSVPYDLTIDGVENEDAYVAGGRISLFRQRPAGVEWGFAFDITTFKFDGEAGHPLHIHGTVAGEPLDVLEESGADDTRVTMYLPSFLLRWPVGRSAEMPSGRWRPYAGGGYGLQHAHIMEPPPDFETDGGTFHVLGGVDALLTRRFSAFVEYRYQRVGDEVTVDGVTTDIVLRSNHIEGGLSLHF